jgi:hypothetical protein
MGGKFRLQSDSHWAKAVLLARFFRSVSNGFPPGFQVYPGGSEWFRGRQGGRQNRVINTIPE